MDTGLKCPRCGAVVKVDRRGHLEVGRCLQCHWEGAGTYFPSQEGLRLVEHRIVRARLEWHNGQVTAKQVLAAKKIVHALDDKPLDVMMKECADSATYDLGTFLEPVARNLKEKAARLGLQIVFE